MSGSKDYRLFASRLKKAVEKAGEKKLTNGSGKLKLPNFPKVEVRGKEIVIINESGEVDYWGLEEDPNTASAIAEEIQKGLQAINYVKFNLVNHLSLVSDELRELGISEDLIDETLYEGYESLKKWFRELDNSE